MLRTTLALLAALLLALATAQDDHSDHDHSDHDLAATPSQLLIELGDRSYALLPLIARTGDGFRGTLALTPAEADEGMGAMDGGMEEHADHSEHDGDMDGEHEHSDGDHGDEEHSDHDDGEHADHDSDMEGDGEVGHDEHADEEHTETVHDHGETLSVALLDPSGAVAAVGELEANADAGGAYGLAWFADAAASDVAGVWRLTITSGEHRADVPIAVAAAASDRTEILAVFAPAPSLSSSGMTETFVHAYRDLEPVHAAMTVQRAMAGMQHSTDEDRVSLIHDHFDALSDLVPVGEAMANRTPLNFAMAGTWEVVVAIAGLESESILLTVDVLAE